MDLVLFRIMLLEPTDISSKLNQDYGESHQEIKRATNQRTMKSVKNIKYLKKSFSLLKLTLRTWLRRKYIFYISKNSIPQFNCSASYSKLPLWKYCSCVFWNLNNFRTDISFAEYFQIFSVINLLFFDHKFRTWSF